MSTATDLVLRSFELTDRHELQALTEVMSTDCEFVTPSASMNGREPLIPYFTPLAEAFPKSHHDIPTVIEAGNVVVVEGTWTGTHDGTLPTPDGGIPPTGKTVSFPFAGIAKVDGDLISSMHIYHDQIPFYSQLGLM